jgi:uncharacterized protein involved in oxidation of intracellular sulfur
MMEYLLVLNDSLYGSQRTYNALRLAGALAKGATREVSIFLLGDVVSGLRRQSPANASYNVPEMLRLLAAQGISSGFPSTLLRIGRRKQFLNSMLSHLTLLMSADSQRGPWLASA